MADRIIRIRVETSGAVNSTGRLGGALGRLNKIALVLGTTTTALTAAIVKQADKWNRLETQLKTVTSTQEELADVQEKLVDLAIETNSTLDGTVNLYARLARATEGTAISQEELLSVTRAVNQSFVLSGASATEAENAIIQLSQGLAAGVFRGEEFNSVAEQGPRLLKALSDALGVTQGELRSLAQEGQLTTSIVVQALKEQTATIEQEFKEVVPTVSASLANLQTKFTQVAGAIDDTVKDVFGESITGAVSTSIDFLTEKLDDFLEILNNVANATILEDLAREQEILNEKTEEQALLYAEIERLSSEIANGNNSFIKGLELENAKSLLEDVNKELTESQFKINELADAAERRFKIEAGEGFIGGVAPESEGDEAAPTGTGLAADLLSAQIEATDKILSDAAAARLEKQKQARQARLDDLIAGRELELEEIRRGLELEQQIRDGVITQEQAQFQQRLERLLQNARERAEKETALRRELAFAQFEQEQSQKEELFLQELANDEATEEERKALIAERNAARLEEQAAFQEAQKALLVSSKEEEQAIRESFAQREIELEKAKQAALQLGQLESASSILKSIEVFGEKSIKVQQAVALAQAGIAIATGIAQAQRLGFPAAIPEAIRVAAVGVKAIRGIQSAKKGSAGSISSGSAGSSASAPSQSAQANTVQRDSTQTVENTALNEIREELASFDPNEPLPSGFTRRIVDSIIIGQSEGTIERF